MFAGRVKIVSHPSCRTSAILKYFCPCCAVISVKYRSNIIETVNALCEVSILEKIIIQHLSFDREFWSDIMP